MSEAPSDLPTPDGRTSKGWAPSSRTPKRPDSSGPVLFVSHLPQRPPRPRGPDRRRIRGPGEKPGPRRPRSRCSGPAPVRGRVAHRLPLHQHRLPGAPRPSSPCGSVERVALGPVAVTSPARANLLSSVPRSRRIFGTRYGRQVQVSRDVFESLVADALDEIPSVLASEMNNVAVVVEEWPTDAQLAGRDGTLLGLYEGVPLTKRDPITYAGVAPDRITIFQGTISAAGAHARRAGRPGPGHRAARGRAPLRHERPAAPRARLG